MRNACPGWLAGLARLVMAQQRTNPHMAHPCSPRASLHAQLSPRCLSPLPLSLSLSLSVHLCFLRPLQASLPQHRTVPAPEVPTDRPLQSGPFFFFPFFFLPLLFSPCVSATILIHASASPRPKDFHTLSLSFTRCDRSHSPPQGRGEPQSSAAAAWRKAPQRMGKKKGKPHTTAVGEKATSYALTFVSP